MTATAMPPELPPRWDALRDHDAQARLQASTARFDVVEAGRRSGKTEFTKREGILEAVEKGGLHPGEPWFTKYCAPTRDQSKFIFWEDLKELSSPWWAKDPKEIELRIFLRGGAELWVCGLDKPQRIEGSPVDRLIIDELADVKLGAWEKHLRPALDTERPGRPPARGWLIGVPRPGTQFAKLAKLAKDPTEPDFAYHHWTAETILSAEKIESAKRTMDPLNYAQEYLAERVNFGGLAYYCWRVEDHYRELSYNPNKPLHICLDFNVEPGVAAIVQELRLEGEKDNRTCVIGEAHIPRNSNTPAICRKLCADWKHHVPSEKDIERNPNAGLVYVYGDASGGARHTSQTEGTDWDLVREILSRTFGDRLRWRVPKSNPHVRDRINSVNARLKNTLDEVRFAVDPKRAPHVVEDFEGVTLLEGGSGEIDKKGCEAQGLTHLTDAIGYYIFERHPIRGRVATFY